MRNASHEWQDLQYNKNRSKNCMLPQKFTERMQDMLGEEYPAFLESYKEDRIQGLRVNTLKGTAADFLTRAPFSLGDR